MRQIEFKRVTTGFVPFDILFVDGQDTRIHLLPETIKDLVKNDVDTTRRQMKILILDELSGFNLTQKEVINVKGVIDKFIDGWYNS